MIVSQVIRTNDVLTAMAPIELKRHKIYTWYLFEVNHKRVDCMVGLLNHGNQCSNNPLFD